MIGVVSEWKVVIWKDDMKANLGNRGICMYQLHVPKICFESPLCCKDVIVINKSYYDNCQQ